MKNYMYEKDEVMLCECTASKVDEDVIECDVLLTNKFIVLALYEKVLFINKETRREQYPVDDIKIYQEQPQIKVSKENVDIYTVENGVLCLRFSDKKAENRFVNELKTLVTGKSSMQRRAEKVNAAIGVVDTALGVKTVDVVTDIVKGGIKSSILGGIGNLFNHGKKEKTVDNGKQKTVEPNAGGSNKIGETIASVVATAVANNQGKENDSAKDESDFNDSYERLIKLKNLYDNGIISQEEFEEQKKKVLR